MAVTTTVLDILNLAYGRNKKNTRVPPVIAESTEGLRIVYRAMRALYAAAARINPAYFGVISDPVAFAVDGWPRPEDAELVYMIEVSPSGERVWVSPITDRLVNTDKPSVYRFGKVYRPIGGSTHGPVGTDSLLFYYSKTPAPFAAVSDVLDPMWNETYNELLGLEVAIYLALKDERTEETQILKQERDQWAQQFVAHLEHETVGEARQFVEDFNTTSLVSLGSMFAGGAQLQER